MKITTAVAQRSYYHNRKSSYPPGPVHDADLHPGFKDLVAMGVFKGVSVVDFDPSGIKDVTIQEAREYLDDVGSQRALQAMIGSERGGKNRHQMINKIRHRMIMLKRSRRWQ